MWLDINLVHVGHRAIHIYVHVGHRAVGFLAGFGNLTVQGRCCQNFVLTVLCFFFFVEKSPSERSQSTSVTPIAFLAAAGLPAPRRLATAPTRHGPASLTPPPP